MTDTRPDPAGAAEPEPSLAETIDSAVRRVTTGIVIAGAIVGLAVYARPAPPRFDAFAVGDRIVRVDMRTGSIIRCEAGRTCELILRRRQKLVRPPKVDAPPKPAAAIPAPAAPAAEKSASAPPG
ncbi:MAG TPA: hypothetical protein VFZ91_01220 [Allosphingosinicella sp.]